MKTLLITSLLILSSLAVFASDLVIESKTQTFSDKEKKIKLDGGVKVKMDNLTVESPRAEVSIRNCLDIYIPHFTCLLYHKFFNISTYKKNYCLYTKKIQKYLFFTIMEHPLQKKLISIFYAFVYNKIERLGIWNFF